MNAECGCKSSSKKCACWWGRYSPKFSFIYLQYLSTLQSPFAGTDFHLIVFLFALCPDTTEPFFLSWKGGGQGETQFPQRFAVRAFDEAHDKFVHHTPHSFALMRAKKNTQIFRYSSTLLII
jgi:hypothetical protein